MINEPRYLGDAVYVDFDGYAIHLLVGSHDDPTDRVVLEPEVLDGFLSFVHQLKEFIAQQRTEKQS